MRFIHAADIHLDSPLAGVTQREPELAALTATCTRDAFTKLVDEAIALDVDLVVIAGDLYDAEHKDYETGLFFAREMRRLERPCVLIHGNHDSTSPITRSLRPPPNVTILSSRKPETKHLPELRAAIHGQSFGNRAETEELAGHYPARVEGMFNIGLLHSSMESPGDHARYAPCRLETLIARHYDYWALGHVHTRADLHDEPWVHFPGNTQGRHVRETGPRGATLVEVDDNLRVRSRLFLPTDVLRWAEIRIDATPIDTMEAMLGLIRVEMAGATASADGRPVIARLAIEGASALHAALLADPADVQAQCAAIAIATGHDLHLERVKLRTRPVEARTGDLGALEQAIRTALADPTLVTSLLKDFERLRNTIPAGAEIEIPQDPSALAGLADDAWEIVRHTLTARPR